jgi:uncharacterized protein (DUF983 family)
MERSQNITVSRVLLFTWRGATKACPSCGRRGLFKRWFTLRTSCPACGLNFEREEGYWTGAIFANLFTTMILFILLMVTAFVVTLPEPPVAELIVGSVLFTIAFPLFFYPFSKTVWMALDRAFSASNHSE